MCCNHIYAIVVAKSQTQFLAIASSLKTQECNLLMISLCHAQVQLMSLDNYLVATEYLATDFKFNTVYQRVSFRHTQESNFYFSFSLYDNIFFCFSYCVISINFRGRVQI
jgi:hypothetical protein